jgi:hypothetical protein
MNHLLPTVVLAALTVSCSPRQAAPAGPPAVNLGKSVQYFTNLYGTPKSEKQVAEFSFPFPNHGRLLHLTRPFVVQEFQSDKLAIKVVYSGSDSQAIWVKYTLPSPWTAQQINAALGAYGERWESTLINPPASLILMDRSPTLYQSGSNTVAIKTLMSELIIYAPQFYLDLQGQVLEAERKKTAVPKF